MLSRILGAQIAVVLRLLALAALASVAVCEVECDILVIPEQFQRCCCDSMTYCWGPAKPFAYNACCLGKYGARLTAECPLDAPMYRDVTPQYRGQRDGEAVYYLKPTLGVGLGREVTARQYMDCEHIPQFAAFRRLLTRYDTVTLIRNASGHSKLTREAAKILSTIRLGSEPDSALALSVDSEFWLFRRYVTITAFANGMSIAPMEDDVCFEGLIAASFVLAMAPGRRAALHVARAMVIDVPYFDLSSSSSWLIGRWDVALNSGAGQPARVETVDYHIRHTKVLVVSAHL
jgi:hypothetical protein